MKIIGDLHITQHAYSRWHWDPREWDWGYEHFWYDGQWHMLRCGLFAISWGGWPYWDAQG